MAPIQTLSRKVSITIGKKRHQGTARISGSKPADMKAALVEKFKSTSADILISTEAGGEGINLQFCSLLINYDLPWNPQKVEQRIGRVHRYGQKNDVVIVNFVNRKTQPMSGCLIFSMRNLDYLKVFLALQMKFWAQFPAILI